MHWGINQTYDPKQEFSIIFSSQCICVSGCIRMERHRGYGL